QVYGIHPCHVRTGPRCARTRLRRTHRGQEARIILSGKRLRKMLSIIPVRGIPDIKKGDDLGKLLVTRLREQGDEFQQGDIAIVSQKIVSKSEGRVVSLSKRSEEHTSELQ